MLIRRPFSGAGLLGAVALVVLLLPVSPVWGQQRNPSGLPAPRLWQVYPPGGKIGATLEVVVSGRGLDEPESLIFSHPGIKAQVVSAPLPEIDPKTKKPKAVMNPLPADSFKFKVTIPPGSPLGLHDVRVVNKSGISNPRVFVVGEFDEIMEQEPNSEDDKAQKVVLNTTINGAINTPTDVDYFAFSAKKGQRIILSCLASSIDSRLRPAIEVYDSQGKQVTANRNYQGDDAVADFTAYADGEYQVRVFQFTHTFRQPIPGAMPAGSSDSYYRLSISTAPWIDAVVPCVVEPGKTTAVTVFGRNLPGGQPDAALKSDDGSVLERLVVNVAVPAERGKLAFSGALLPPSAFMDTHELRVKNAAGSSNPFLLHLAKAPVVLDQGNNDAPETAQEISLPCEIAGQVEKRRDRDWFAFNAKKGEVWNFEVFSSRLGAPTYMMMVLRNPTSKSEMYESPLQDNPQMYAPRFYARTDDPAPYKFTAPADGKYQLLVASRSGDTLYGVRHSYQVRITRDEPDFRLVAISSEVATPDAPLLRAGGRAAYNVLIQRDGGFTGDVQLKVEGLPAGVTCAPQVLAGNVRQTTLVVEAAPDAASWTGELRIKGTATINGKPVVMEARAGGVLWPVQAMQNIPTVSRVERGIYLAVRDKALFSLTASLDKAEIPQGDKATLTVKLNRVSPDIKGPVQVGFMQSPQRQGSEFPTNLKFNNNNQPIAINAGQAEAKFPVTVGIDVPPGEYNIVLRGQTQMNYTKPGSKAKAMANVFAVEPSSAVRLLVLPKSLATLTATPPQAAVKLGGSVKVQVRVQRRFNYEGEFKVKLELPKGMTDLTAGEVLIPAGKDEAELVVNVQPNATPGPKANLLVKATAMFAGRPVEHETKISVNVTK